MKRFKVFSEVLACLLVFTLITSGCGGNKAGTANSAAGSEEQQVSGSGSQTSTQSSSGTASSGDITLTTLRWAGPHADDQAEVLKKFENETGIKVKQDAIDYGQLYQKEVLNMASKTGVYDLIWAQEIWLPKYMSSGYLKPLDEYLSNKSLTGEDFDIGNYNQSIIKINTYDGKLYGLPTFVQTPIMVYNKEMLDKEGLKAPGTWQETLEVAKYFKQKGTGIALPAKQGMAAVDVWAALMRSNEGDYFDSNGKLNLASDANVETAKFWKELTKYSMNGSTNWHYDEVNKAVQFGQAPIGITASGLCGVFQDTENSKVAGKVGFVPLPYNKKVYGTLAFWSWCVANDSKHPEEAFKLAAWLTSKEIEKEQTIKNGQISAVASLFNDSELVSQLPFLPAVGKALENSNTQPLDDNATKLSEKMEVVLSSIATSDIDPKSALERAQKDLESLYNK